MCDHTAATAFRHSFAASARKIRSVDRETRRAVRTLALSARPIAWSDIDLVYAVSISLGFAENRAMLSLHVDPCDRKRIVLGIAAQEKDEGIANRDTRRQTVVLISLASRGDEPAAALGQHPQGARYDGLDVLGGGPTETTRDD